MEKKQEESYMNMIRKSEVQYKKLQYFSFAEIHQTNPPSNRFYGGFYDMFS